jgi:hypothetical protein
VPLKGGYFGLCIWSITYVYTCTYNFIFQHITKTDSVSKRSLLYISCIFLIDNTWTFNISANRMIIKERIQNSKLNGVVTTSYIKGGLEPPWSSQDGVGLGWGRSLQSSVASRISKTAWFYYISVIFSCREFVDCTNLFFKKWR